MPDRIMTAEARITARDATGTVFGQIARKMKGIESTAQGVNSRLGGLAAGIGSRVLAVAGPAAMAAYTAHSVQQFATTERRLGRILTTAGTGREEFAKTLRQVQTLAIETGQSTDSVLSGLEAKVAQGSTLQEAMAQLPIIVKTAMAAGAETQDIANSIGAIGEQLKVTTPQMQSAMDMLVTSGKEGKFELKDMSRYLPQIAAAAAATGETGIDGLNRIAAALQVVRTGTGTSEEAATNLLNIFAKMNSQETIKRFGKFGIDLPKRMAEAKKAGKDAMETFVALAKEAVHGDMSKLPQLFSDMQVQAGMRPLINGMDELHRQMAINRQGVGAMGRDLAERMKDAQVSIDRAKESITQFGTVLGGIVSPTVVESLDRITGVMQRMSHGTDPGGGAIVMPNNAAVPDGLTRTPAAGASSSANARAAAAWRAYESRTGMGGYAAARAAARAGYDDDRSWWQSMEGGSERGNGPGSALRNTAHWRGGKTKGEMIENERKVQDFLRTLPELLRQARADFPGMHPSELAGGVRRRFNIDGKVKELMDSEADRAGQPRPTVADIGARVEAELRGAVDVVSQVQVKVSASPEFEARVESIVNRAVSNSPNLRTNGPGSVGTSSPDAAAPRHVGRGDL